jgi:hypothetical protein
MTTNNIRDHRYPRCPRCFVIWRQSGNRTGHCRTCCRTFDSAAAFDAHRRGGVCLDPAALLRPDIVPMFEYRTAVAGLDAGTIYWRLTMTEAQRMYFASLTHGSEPA